MNKHDIEIYLYKMYNEELVKNTEIDWFDVEKVLNKIGNAPGIYPDTLLLFTKIINHCSPRKIIEFGSGVSTLYFSKICKDKNIQFTSYEEKPEWKNKTQHLLNHYKLNSQINDFVNLNDITFDDDITFDTDIMFIDCSVELRIKLLESDKLNYIPIIMVDDSERTNLSKYCSKFMSNSKRYNFYVYNGVGRIDRHLFINSTSIDIDNIIKQ